VRSPIPSLQVVANEQMILVLMHWFLAHQSHQKPKVTENMKTFQCARLTKTLKKIETKATKKRPPTLSKTSLGL
jgi:hypothetical protein